MKTFPFALSFAAFLAASPPAAGPFDPSFGDTGIAHYGFQPVDNLNGDSARAGCPGPNGTFVVVGAASGGRRVVTLRLLPDGRLDTTFSGDGKESFDLAADYPAYAPAVCLPQGDAVIATSVTAPSGEQHLRLVRVGRDTGLPAAAFGNAGVVDLDLDAHIAGLDKVESPMGLNVLGNGDLVVTGYVSRPGVPVSGFAALLDATGQVRAARIVDCWMASSAIESAQGALWIVGSTGYAGCRLTLDRNTLAPIDRLVASPGASALFPGAARAVNADTVAMAGTIAAADGRGRPALVLFRGNTVTTLALPDLSATGVDLVGGGVTLPGVQILPGGRVLYGATSEADTPGTVNALYFALVRVGRDAAGDRLETAFGSGGAQLGRWPANAAGCDPAPPQWLHRLTQWQGRPAFVGKVDARCIDGTAGEDYLVGRVETNYLFADGMD